MYFLYKMRIKKLIDIINPRISKSNRTSDMKSYLVISLIDIIFVELLYFQSILCSQSRTLKQLHLAYTSLQLHLRDIFFAVGYNLNNSPLLMNLKYELSLSRSTNKCSFSLSQWRWLEIVSITFPSSKLLIQSIKLNKPFNRPRKTLCLIKCTNKTPTIAHFYLP